VHAERHLVARRWRERIAHVYRSTSTAGSLHFEETAVRSGEIHKYSPCPDAIEHGWCREFIGIHHRGRAADGLSLRLMGVAAADTGEPLSVVKLLLPIGDVQQMELRVHAIHRFDGIDIPHVIARVGFQPQPMHASPKFRTG
jgi:hypothetical protein